MAVLTNVTKTAATLTGIVKEVGGGVVFYGWLFLFTVPQYSLNVTNVAKNAGTITNIVKN